MRFLATAFALVLTTSAGAVAHVDPGLRHLADIAPRSPTGGAVLGTLPPDGPCPDTQADTRCGARAALTAFVRRETEIAQLSADWDAPARDAFAVLRHAEHTYAAAIARNEVDRRGADGEDQAEAAAEAQDEAFVGLLRRTTDTTGRSIALDVSLRDANATLNQTYRLVMAEPIASGAVTRIGVRNTQRAWLAYRDAFAMLATVLERPTAPIAAELTAARTRDLEGLVAD